MSTVDRVATTARRGANPPAVNHTSTPKRDLRLVALSITPSQAAPIRCSERFEWVFGKALGLSDLSCSVFVHLLCATGIMLTLHTRRPECVSLYLSCRVLLEF